MTLPAAVFVIRTNAGIPGFRGNATIIPPAGGPLGHGK